MLKTCAYSRLVSTGSPSSLIAAGHLLPQLEAEPEPVRVGIQDAAARAGRAVEQHLLDAGVIVEVLDVHERSERAADVGVDRGARVSGELERARFAERRDAEHRRDPPA